MFRIYIFIESSKGWNCFSCISHPQIYQTCAEWGKERCNQTRWIITMCFSLVRCHKTGHGTKRWRIVVTWPSVLTDHMAVSTSRSFQGRLLAWKEDFERVLKRPAECFILVFWTHIGLTFHLPLEKAPQSWTFVLESQNWTHQVIELVIIVHYSNIQLTPTAGWYWIF